MAAGVKFGRKPKLSDFQRAEALKRRAAGETLAWRGFCFAAGVAVLHYWRRADSVLCWIASEIPIAPDSPLPPSVPCGGGCLFLVVLLQSCLRE
jgi:hypothetical protein